MADLVAWLVRSPALTARLIRFGAVGGITSAAYALIVAALAPDTGEALAAALAYLALLPVNYLGHRRATFRSRAPSRPELLRYLAVHAATMATCTAVMHGVTAGLGQSHWAGSAIIVIMAPVLNFVLLHRWVFR